MGWTSYHATHYKNGKIDRKAECDAYFEDSSGSHKVLKSSMKGSTYYAAVKIMVKRDGTDINGNPIYKQIDDGDVFGVVFKTATDQKDYFNFSYKPMDETEGPYESECPVSILNLLTPTDNEYALEWRKRCRNNALEKSFEKKNPDSLVNLPLKSRIRFTNEYDLTSGVKRGDSIELIKVFNPFTGKECWSDGHYRWKPGLISKDYEIFDIEIGEFRKAKRFFPSNIIMPEKSEPEHYKEEQQEEKPEIECMTYGGFDYKVIDKWQDDIGTYVVGQTEADDGTWYAAKVTDTTEQYHGEYEYEFGNGRPSRSDVEDAHLNHISQIDFDRHEAEFGADGSRVFPHLNDPSPEEEMER